MSTGAFRCLGSSGPAVNTLSWGSLMPDSYNMLVPGHWVAATINEIIYDSLTTANFFNQMILDNLSYHFGGPNTFTGSFGALSTAPDGTNTAQKYIEATTNSKHYVTAGFRSISTDQNGKLRFAAFLKYSGRRVGMEITNGTIDNDYGGATVIFDLLGGQIGVAPFSHGSFYPYTPIDAKIAPRGDGWYLCTFDVDTTITNIGPSKDKRCAIFLDAGTGTGAANQTYTGDGTSGVIGWKVNCLPVAAWAMTSRAYFEDFNDGLTTFDMADTRVSGFRWYINHFWPGYPTFNTPCSVSNIAVSSSILTLTGGGNNYTPPGTDILSIIQSNTYGGSPGQTNGYEMKGPFLIETRASWDYPNGGGFPNEIVGVWTAGSQGLAQSPSGIGFEIDFFELPAGGGLFQFTSPNTSVLSFGLAGTGSSTVGQYGSINGYVPWYANREYQGGYCVHHLGVFYECTSNVGPSATPPASDPTHWQLYTASFRNLILPSTLPGLAVDLSTMHTYSTLFIPYTKGDYGYCITFFDGVFASFIATWSPYEEGSRQAHTGDGQSFGIWMNSVKLGMTLNIDSFRTIGS